MTSSFIQRERGVAVRGDVHPRRVSPFQASDSVHGSPNVGVPRASFSKSPAGKMCPGTNHFYCPRDFLDLPTPTLNTSVGSTAPLLYLRPAESKCSLDPNGFANLRPSPAFGFIRYSLASCLPRQEEGVLLGRVLSAECSVSPGGASALGLEKPLLCVVSDPFPSERASFQTKAAEPALGTECRRLPGSERTPRSSRSPPLNFG